MPEVYAAIAAVMGELASEGIAKDRRNEAQKYAFRGIDDVYNALAPLLSKHGLLVLPRMMSRSEEERKTANGGRMGYVTIEAEFDFVCASDGSKHTVRTFGEAMDSADKATNKAMSAAFKYACIQSFCIPTEGDDNDADAHTPQVQPRKAQPKAEPKKDQKPDEPATRPKSEIDAEDRAKAGTEFIRGLGLTVSQLDAYKQKVKAAGWDAREVAYAAKSEGVTTSEELDLYVMSKLQERGKAA